MNIDRITRCRVCGNSNLETVVDLGRQALSGRFPRIGTADPPVAPLELVRCTGRGCCGLVQLVHRIPLTELYGEGYGYLSGLNTSMKQHLEDVVRMAESMVHLEKKDLVLDIGSNDGTLLKAYTNKDIQRVGMDAKHFKKHYKDTDIVFIPRFFQKEIMFEDDKPKIITSIAMFYDLEDPNKFVEDIKAILHPQGVWIVEQLYLPKMLDNNAFDACCSEHLEYYSLSQMIWLLEKHGLRAFKVDFNDTNGNSFLLCVCHKDAPWLDISDILHVICEGEQLDFIGFNERIQHIKERLVDFLLKEKEAGKTIHLYGASTKVNVLLQYFGIDYRIVSYAAERNSSKFNCWSPGTHIPIIAEEESRKMKPDYYLVGPWHFRESFISQMKEYMRQGGSLIFPLPNPEIVSMKDGELVVQKL